MWHKKKEIENKKLERERGGGDRTRKLEKKNCEMKKVECENDTIVNQVKVLGQAKKKLKKSSKLLYKEIF